MRFRPFSVWYAIEGGELVVYLAGRDEARKRRVVRVLGTQPHFYATEDKQHDLIEGVDTWAAKSLDGRPVHRVRVKYPFNVPEVRGEFQETFEADIVYAQRVRYDLGIRNVIRVPDKDTIHASEVVPDDLNPSIEPRVVVWDIETYDKGQFAEPQMPTNPVVSISLWDSYTDRYFTILNGDLSPEQTNRAAAFYAEKGWKVQTICVKNEAELFAVFAAFIDQCKPDILAGWNSGKWSDDLDKQPGYDVPYIGNRAKAQSYPCPDWKRYVCFDLMRAYERKHEGELDSAALDYVGWHEGIGTKVKTGRVWQMYESDRHSLVIYNVNDVWLTKEIAKKQSLVNFFLELASFAGCNLQDLWDGDRKDVNFQMGRIVDSFVFHRLKRDKIVQPSKVYVPKQKIEGAKVYTPSSGVFPLVVEVDNSGEYANIIRTLNLSPETKTDDTENCHLLPSGNSYVKSPRGVFPSIIDELLVIRENKKRSGEEEQYRVVKEMVNTFYGVLASPFYRNSDPAIAADITDIARKHLDWNKRFIEENGGELIYGDTDSCLFHFPGGRLTYEQVEQEAKRLVDELNGTLHTFAAQYGAEQSYLSVKFEHVYEGFLQAGKKKRYACIYRDPKGAIERNGVRYTMKVRGFEVRRSSAALITKRVQQEVFKRALFGEEVADYLRGVVADLRAGKVEPNQFGVPIGLGKEHYTKSNPQHSKAAAWSNENLGANFRQGSKPRLFFGQVRGKPHTKVFALDWDEPLPEGTEIDWDATIERVIVGPLEDVLDVLGITRQDLLRPTHKLEDYA